MDPDITWGRKNKGLGQHPGEHRDLGGKWRRPRRERQVSGGERLPQRGHLPGTEKVPRTPPGFGDCEHRWPGSLDLTKASKVFCSSSHSISSSLLYSGSVLSASSPEAGLLCNSAASSLHNLVFRLAILFAVAKPVSLRASHFKIKLCQSAALSLIFLALTDKTGFLGVVLPRGFAWHVPSRCSGGVR